MQFTYEYCRHLTCGVGGPRGPPSTLIIPQALPLFQVNTPHIHNIYISYLALIRPNYFLWHTLNLTLFKSGTPIIGSSRTSSGPQINHTISICYLTLFWPNFFLRQSHHLILPYKGPNSFQSFPSGVKPAAAKTYTSIRSLTYVTLRLGNPFLLGLSQQQPTSIPPRLPMVIQQVPNLTHLHGGTHALAGPKSPYFTH